MSTIKNTIYVAGPMRGLPGNNFKAFDDAAARLRRLGWDVVNPAELDREAGISADTAPEEVELRDVVRRDVLAIIDRCGAMALLSGWEASKGARAERDLAIWLGIPVVSMAWSDAMLKDAVPRG